MDNSYYYYYNNNKAFKMENTENQDVYNQKLKSLHKQYKSLIEFFINKNSIKKLTTNYKKLLSVKDILELKKKNIIDLDNLESFLIKLKDCYEKQTKPSTSMGVINLVDDSDEDDEVQFVGYGKLTEIKNSQNIKEENKPAVNSAEKKENDKCDIKYNISKTVPGDLGFHILKNDLEEMELDHNYFVHPSDVEQSNELHTDTDVQKDSEASITLCNETDSNDITNSKKSDILKHSGDKNEVNDTTENSSELKKVKSDHKNENKENVISTKQSDKKSNYPTKEPLDSKENKLQNDMFDQNQLIKKSNQIEFNSNNSDVSNKYKNIFDLIDNSLSDVSDEDLDNNKSSEELLEREQIQLTSSPKEKPMKNKKRKKEKKHKKREKIETDSIKKSIGDSPKNIETNISSVKSKTSLLKSSKLQENNSDEHQNMNETASEWSKIASSYETWNSLSDVHVKTVVKKSEKSGLDDHIDLRNSVLYDDFELEPSIEDYEYLGLEFPNKVKKLALIDKQSSDDDLKKDQQESKQNKVPKLFDDIDDGLLFLKTFGSNQTENESENNVNKDSPKNQNKSDKSHSSVLDKELPNEIGTELMEERNSLFHRRQNKPEQEQLSYDSEDNINDFLRQLDEAIENDEDKLLVNNSDEKNTLSINKIICTKLQNTEKCNKLVKNEEILKSPKQLGVIVIDESSDEDENEVNQNENVEDNTFSRETSPLTVKIVSRENTPPRVVSPDHLKEIINASEILSQTKNQDVSNKCESRNRENHIIQRNDKNENSQNEIHSSSEKNHNSFLKFFNVTEENENETSLSELLRIRQEFEAKIPLSRSQIEKIIGFTNENTEITDDYESNQIEDDQSNETSSIQNFDVSPPNCNRSETNFQNIEINTGILNNVCQAISQIINKNEMNAIQSQTFNTTCVTPPSNFPIQNNFIPQQSNIYNSNVLNYPRYPTVNPNDPRLRNRLKHLFQKTEKNSVQQKTQQHHVPFPPPGPPLTLDQLPESQSVSQTPKKTEIPKVGTSKFTKKYEQAKQAALARKAEKEKERKQKEYSETMFEKMSKIPNTESVMDKMYRTGQYFLESSTPVGFKIPKKKTEEENHQINKSEIQSSSINSKPLKNRRRSLSALEEISDESNRLSDFPVEIDKTQTNAVKPKPIRNRRQSSYAPESISDESKEIKDFDAENNKVVKPKPVRARRQSLFQPKMENKEIQSNAIKSKTLKNRRKSLSSLNEIFNESERVKDFNLEIDKTQSNTLKSKPVRNRRRSVTSKGKNKMNDFEEEDNKGSFDVSDIYFDISDEDKSEDNINEAIKKSINNKNNNKKINFNSDDDNDENKSDKNSSDCSRDNVIKEALQKLKNKLSEDKYLKIENIIKKHECVESQEFLSSNSTVPTKCRHSKKLKNKTTSTNEVDKLKTDIANSFMAKDVFNINFTRKCSEVAKKKMKNIMESTENHNKTVIEKESVSNSEDEESECKKLKIRKRRKSMNATFNENSNYVLQDDDGEDTDDYTEDKAKKRKTHSSSTSIKLISEEVQTPMILLKKLKPDDIMALSSCKQLNKENKKETVFDDNDPLLKVIKEVPDNLKICQKKKISNGKNSRIKNKNPEYHINSKYMQFCVLCYAQDISENKIVSHYVDEHPSDEVFVSRLQKTDIDLLKVNQNVAALSQEETAGSMKYSTECIFCKNIIKVESFVKFNTHYSTHTGEYQYKCSECDIRKWNKKDIKKHCKDECEDARIQTYYSFDKNANIIYIYVCDRCSYVQLHKANIEKHLKTEHGFDRISESDILQLKLTERVPDPAMYEGNGRFEVSHENIPFFNGDESFNENDIRIKNEIIEGISPKMNIDQGSNVMTVVHGINSLSNECSSYTEEEITQNPLNESQNNLDGNEEIDIKPTIVDENNYLYLENFDLNSTSVNEDLQKDIKIENGENAIVDENGLVDENPVSIPQIIAVYLNKDERKSLESSQIPATNNLEAENDSETVTELQSSKDNVSLWKNKENLLQDQQHISTQNIDEVICSDDNDNKKCNNDNRLAENDETISTTDERRTIDNQICSEVVNNSKQNVEFDLDATELAQKFSLIKSLKENPNATEIYNFCYETRNEGIYLYCLINECSFTNTMDFKIFESHVELNHGTRMWNGICKVCRKNVTNDKHVPVINEIKHMIQNHLRIYQKTPPCKRLRLSNDDEALESIIITQLLKPWIKKTISKKTRSQCEKMKQIDALSVQYKCMGINCAFITNEKSEMINHLEKHIHLDQNELKAHLECCYCDSYFKNSIQLVGHINEIHGTSTFQCSKCFYRSAVEFNVLTHLNLFHQNDKNNNQIIECIGKIKNLQYEKVEVLQGRSKNVISLQCKVCSMKFYVKNYLYNHMKNKHNITDKNQLPDIGVFACTYCKFDCKILQDIREHLANEHPSKLLYVCGRGAPNRSFCFNNVEYETSINSTCIVFVGESVPNCLIKRLHVNDKNSQDLNNDQNPLPSTSAKELSDDVNLSLEEFDDALVDMEDFIKHMEDPYPRKKSDINNYSCNYNKLKTLIHKLACNNGSLLGKQLYLCAKYDCKESFETLEEWKVHMTDKHPKSKKNVRFACPHCPRKSWMNINDLAEHFDTHKADIGKFICYFCGDLLSTLELAKMHISNKHSSISVKIITLENKKEESEFNLVVTHDIQDNKSQLLRHMITVLEIKLGINVNESENMDMETYKNNNNANKNILLSTPTSKKNDNDLPIFISIYRRYICNYNSCEIKFEDKCSFEKHIRQLHNSETIYKCPHCNDKFLINNSKFYEIINHMKLHSRTVYQCSGCSDYIAADKLNKHINEMHNNENLTIIRYLRNEQFVKKLIIVSLAITSKKTISTIGIYICFLCSLNFNDLQSMKNHMLSDHNFAILYHCVHCTTVREDNENSILTHLISNHLNEKQQRIYISFHKNFTTGLLEDFTCKVPLTLTNDESNKDDCDDDDVIIIDDDYLDNNSSVVNKKRLLTNENTNENQKKLKLSEISTKSELFKCAKCNFSTDTKEAMTDHTKYNHNHHINDADEKEFNIHLVLPSTSSTNYDQNINQLYKCDVAGCCFLCDDESNLNEHKLINHKRMLLNKPQRQIITQNSSFGNIKMTVPNKDCIQVDPPSSNSFSPQIHSTEENKPQEQKPQTGLIRVKPMEKLLANPRNTVTSTSEMPPLCWNDSSSCNLLSKPLAPTITLKSHGLFPDIAFKCNYCNVAFEDINNLYQHWKQVHAATHPFEYRIDQFLCCLYCNRVSTFENLKNHHTVNHHSDVFVTRLLSNKLKCTECIYKCPANNLAEFKIHFRNIHPDMILRKNISVDFIDDNLFNALLQIDYTVFSFKCKYCETIFRRNEECEKHITEYHPIKSLVCVKFLEKRIFYSCRNCRNSIHLNEKQAVEHIIKTHIRPYICKICESYQFYNLDNLSHHIRNIHNNQFYIQHYEQEIFDNFTLYKEMIVMFPNGLVLTKHELKNTRYYNAEEFKQLILTTEAEIEKEKAARI